MLLDILFAFVVIFAVAVIIGVGGSVAFDKWLRTPLKRKINNIEVIDYEEVK